MIRRTLKIRKLKDYTITDYLYEMDKLGIDVKNRSCVEIKTNIIDEKSGYKQEYYLCKFGLNE